MTEMGNSLGQRMLAAIMFTDVVNFSKHVAENEERALRLVQRDLQAIADYATRFSGQILKNTGDGCMLLFTSGVQAVECAQAIQRQFAEQKTQMPPRDVLQHRIGIHLGDVILTGGEVMGDGVNIAARLQMEAPPGGICISQALYEVVRTRLSLQTVQIGMRQLKNIPESVVVYQVMVGPASAHVTHAPAPPVARRPAPAAPSSAIAGAGPWPWILAVVAVLAIAAAFIIPMLLHARQNPPNGSGMPGQQVQQPSPGTTPTAMPSAQPSTTPAPATTTPPSATSSTPTAPASGAGTATPANASSSTTTSAQSPTATNTQGQPAVQPGGNSTAGGPGMLPPPPPGGIAGGTGPGGRLLRPRQQPGMGGGLYRPRRLPNGPDSQPTNPGPATGGN